MMVARPDVLADKGDEGANIILVGGEALPDRAAVVQAVAAQGLLAVSDPPTVDAFTDGATLLTDDYAPVDQLVGNPAQPPSPACQRWGGPGGPPHHGRVRPAGRP